MQIPEVFSFSFLHGWWCRKGAWVNCKVEKTSVSSCLVSGFNIFVFYLNLSIEGNCSSLKKLFWMLCLNVQLTSGIKDCMASVPPLSQCWGPTSSFSTWGALAAWAWMFSKKKVRWSHPPRPNLPVKGLGSSGGRSHCIKALLWGTGRCRTSSLYGSHLDHGGGCVPWRRTLLEGKKGFYLTIYKIL